MQKLRKKKDKKDDLAEYRIGNVTLLQLMGGLAILGIFVWCVARWLLK